MGITSIRREELEKLDREDLYKLIFEIELDNHTLHKKLDESLDSINKAHMLVVEMNKRLNEVSNESLMKGVRYSDSTGSWSNVECANKASLFYKFCK